VGFCTYEALSRFQEKLMQYCLQIFLPEISSAAKNLPHPPKNVSL